MADGQTAYRWAAAVGRQIDQPFPDAKTCGNGRCQGCYPKDEGVQE